jgi:hypothetical protein
MRRRAIQLGTAALVGVMMCAAAYLLVGCVGELVAIVPTDMGASVEGDMTPAMEMGDGQVHFIPDIQNDVDRLTCTLSACHGGGLNTPMLKAAPMTQADKDTSYMSFKMVCDPTNPSMSLVIQYALGNNAHPGGAVLKMTDPAYQRWINWIMAGEIE